MSTASAIGMTMADGSVKAIRCNWNGYPGNVGLILLESYHEPDKVAALLALGEISILGSMLAPESGQYHTFRCPASDVVVAYHRDRGEPLQPPVVFKDAEDFTTNGQSEMGVDYLYLFAEGKWLLGGYKDLSNYVN